ncbi:hypothetical protein DO72_6758 [Burkholderia pseudomallei]|nr:hypothetical protein DP44_5006 [Burkholderia pseudomallei]KGD50417.1 hypothetical protein DO72_6758 [Burkholderia pseudomallei]KGS88929.1 hypothetical protein X976_5316 [Burkholderia pseudomallei MSHR7500]
MRRTSAICETLIRVAARSATQPSSAIRTSRNSSSISIVIGGTTSARFGPSASARSARSRVSAARTGIVDEPTASATLRRLSAWPGAKRPLISASRSCW